MSRTTTSAQPVCQFCVNAGIPGQLHRINHCPTLKENICTFCKKKGHTSKYCEKKKKQQQQAAVTDVKKTAVVPPLVRQKKCVNMFDLLNEEQEQEQEQKKPEKKQKEVLPFSYAAAVKGEIITPIVVEKPILERQVQVVGEKKKISWAEMNDDSSSDEEEW